MNRDLLLERLAQAQGEYDMIRAEVTRAVDRVRTDYDSRSNREQRQQDRLAEAVSKLQAAIERMPTRIEVIGRQQPAQPRRIKVRIGSNDELIAEEDNGNLQ